MRVETKEHLIAASNFLMGVTNFLILPLPKGWRLVQGSSPPEVDSNTQRGDYSWVSSGRASHVLFDEDRGAGLELLVSISKGKGKEFKPKLSQMRDQGLIRLGGHEANYALGEVERGFFKKKVAQSLQLALYCDKTNRTIAMEFTGKCLTDDLNQILEAISLLQCH